MADSTVCPESTLESANRRNFIRKAAVVTAAATVGTGLLSKSIAIPESSAAASTCTTFPCSILVHDNVWVDQGNLNNGSSLHSGGLIFGKFCSCGGSGEGISSNRTSGCECGPCNKYGLDFYTAQKKRISVTQNGRVGIGTVEPASKLEVVGTISGSSLCSIAVCGTATGNSIHSIGVSGRGPHYGVYASGCCTGVYGLTSVCGTGVAGVSCNGVGVKGTTDSGTAVYGGTLSCCCGNTGIGVEAFSLYGVGLKASTTSGPAAALFKGNVGINAPGCIPSSALCVLGGIRSGWRRGFPVPACTAVYAYSGYYAVYGVSCSGNGVRGGTCYGTGVYGGTGSCCCGCNNGIGVEAFSLRGIGLKASSQSGPAAGVFSGNVGINNCKPAVSLAVCGGLSVHVATPSGAYTMTKSDYAVLAKGNVTLPVASTAKGMIVFIKSITATAITVSAVDSDKIEGKASESLAKKYDSLTLISDGNSPGNWYIQSNAK
jgi:hypothetical protein